jgi:hypothetical protein
MNLSLALAVAMTGQVCQVRGTYRQQAVTYAAPVAYQQQNYVKAYAAPVYTQFVAVAEDPYLYQSALVGAQARADRRAGKELQGQAALAAQLNGLSVQVNQLTRTLAQVTIATPTTPDVGGPPVAPGKPQPVAPGKPSPEVPGKPAPTVEAPPPVQPPTPTVNPDDGSVPPPPVPTVPGVAVPDATVQVLKSRCLACHSAESAATNGGKFALFTEAGDVRPLSSPKLLDLAFRVSTGNMPRKALPLPPEEQATIKAWVLADPKVAGFLGATTAGVTK